MFEAIDLATLAGMAGALVVSGALIGVLAGLFGVGGGAISVPVFFEIFRLMGMSADVAMPLAVGTSLAVIVPTSVSSARGHYLRGTVDMGILRLWALPVLAGVAIGSALARYAPPGVFQAVFILVAGVNAVKLLTGGKGWSLAPTLPSGPVLRVYGAGIGLISALMGIGGGAVSNLVLTLHGVPILRAISTSAGVGVLISIPGALGYMVAGWGREGLPPDAIGFVSLLAFALTIPTTLLTTRFGVRLAHAMQRRTLELLFGSFLVLICLRFVAALAGLF